jgi:hypothetical protein
MQLPKLARSDQHQTRPPASAILVMPVMGGHVQVLSKKRMSYAVLSDFSRISIQLFSNRLIFFLQRAGVAASML